MEKYFNVITLKEFVSWNQLFLETSLVKALIWRKKCWFWRKNRALFLVWHFPTLWPCVLFLVTMLIPRNSWWKNVWCYSFYTYLSYMMLDDIQGAQRKILQLQYCSCKIFLCAPCKLLNKVEPVEQDDWFVFYFIFQFLANSNCFHNKLNIFWKRLETKIGCLKNL